MCNPSKKESVVPLEPSSQTFGLLGLQAVLRQVRLNLIQQLLLPAIGMADSDYACSKIREVNKQPQSFEGLSKLTSFVTLPGEINSKEVE